MLQLRSEYEGKVLHSINDLSDDILEILKKEDVFKKYFIEI
jgi:hypothetical protein